MIKLTLKVAAAGVIAFLLLCGFAAMYYNPSAHLPSPDGVTDYIREPGAFYAYMTEGCSVGRVDGNGFNNPGAMAQNADSPDILFMGSSHIEAMYVMQDESAPYLLNEILATEGTTVYNIAMSAHDLERCLMNLDTALTVYQPCEYVVIESMSATFSVKNMEALLEGTYERETSFDKSDPRYWLQQPPFVKLIYSQYRDAMKSAGTPAAAPPPRDEVRYRKAVGEIVALLADTAAAHGVKAIVVYHPTLSLREDGSAVTTDNREDVALFAQICVQAGVRFVDMRDIFLEQYAMRHVLPHGFPNTKIGVGHLNSQGQRMVAEEIARIIRAGG